METTAHLFPIRLSCLRPVQCYHINHVSTQIPYACTVAAVSVVCYIIAGFVRNAAISLVIAFVLMALVLLILKKVFGTEEKA
ncbi:MAG: Na+/H+ antiporter NhaC family protein [Anaerovoracaceae bacterium]